MHPTTVLVADDKRDHAEHISRWLVEAAVEYFAEGRPIEVRGMALMSKGRPIFQSVTIDDPEKAERFLRSGHADIAFVDYRWTPYEPAPGRVLWRLMDAAPPHMTEFIVMSTTTPISAGIKRSQFCPKMRDQLKARMLHELAQHQKRSARARLSGAYRRFRHRGGGVTAL